MNTHPVTSNSAIDRLKQRAVLVKVEQFGAEHVIVFGNYEIQLYPVEVVLRNHKIDGRNGAVCKPDFGCMK